ncbi:DNA polymerase-4 [Rhodoligotrophos appendicifer]|uniref:DNA polymerase IV n=1 Tax=Rhodoligotrophos appendicifer TaxID=987056 RepID=UPI00118548F7|nr:DNA polymerase IV [Rhodoligotrophos appendicifer]
MVEASPSSLPSQGLCRDCFHMLEGTQRRCRQCGSPRTVSHPELHQLSIAHLDCDAFYAAIEKRDDPSLIDKPVIIGGGRRGVVATACYIARISGVGSAMPMFKALKLCPEAVVIRPNMEKYLDVGRKVRALMEELTPLVQPISIDEAFLDLTGTARLHGYSPAAALARLARKVEKEIGITVSIGLSHNKFLAKVASDLDKPRGFSLIGRTETLSFLAPRPVGLIWGVGRAMQAKLAKDGITRIERLQSMDLGDLMRRYGTMGSRLYHLSRGLDDRSVTTERDTKSISGETTFNEDISDFSLLEQILWRMCEKVSRRAKAAGLGGATVVLKLKSADFKIRTRNARLEEPSQLAIRIFQLARPMLQREAQGTAFRLLGVGISDLCAAEACDPQRPLDPAAVRLADAERAMDRVRDKFGSLAVGKGLAFQPSPKRPQAKA